MEDKVLELEVTFKQLDVFFDIREFINYKHFEYRVKSPSFWRWLFNMPTLWVLTIRF